MDPDELAAWLRLALTPSVGPAAQRRLLARWGLPQQVFQASHDALCTVVTPAQAQALREAPEGWREQVEASRQWLAQAPAQRRLITLADTDYPQALLHLADPPLLLWVQAEGLAQDAPLPWPAQALALVGSRHATHQGLAHAYRFAQELAQAGLCVVSGLARGIDGAAHEGALAGAPQHLALATIAVVGTGLDRVYPAAHHALARRIAQRGLLVSEFPLGTPPRAEHFPRRNRLIAALARGTLVVEATLQSGSLITARLALELGREVFAIPGSIHAEQSRGCHALLRQGAALVETAKDILEELGCPTPAPGPSTMLVPEAPAPQSDEAALLAALDYDPVSLDTLQARTGLPTDRLQASLLALELRGEVARLPGARLQRVALA